MISRKKRRRCLIALLLFLNFLCFGQITGLYYFEPYPSGISLRIHHGNLVWMEKPESRRYHANDFSPRCTLWFQTKEKILFWRP